MSAARVQGYVDAFHQAAFERWLTSLDSAAGALAGNEDLLQRLQDPSTEFAERQRLLEPALPAGTDSLVRNLLYTMQEHGDLGIVGEVAQALRQKLASAESGPTAVEVTSAIELEAAQRNALESKLAAQYGSNLAFAYKIDPAILGGVIVRVGDKLIDGSVATRLAAMKQTLGVKSNE